MHPPSVRVWIPKTESEKPSSSRSNQKTPSRISRAITRSVSNILPSSSSQPVDQATQNLPTCHHRYTSATGSTPASGLSSILAGIACEPTTPDVLLHASRLPLGATNTSGATSSHTINNQRSGCKETLPNPFSRTNLLTTTPIFKDSSFTPPRGPRKHSRNPKSSTGASTSANPALRDPMSATNYSRKDKRGIPLPDALLHAPQLTLGASHAPGATSSHVIDNQRSGCKETLSNPFPRKNLLTTTTPTFKAAGSTAPRGPRKYRRNPEFNTGASTSPDPALRDPIITTNYSHKDKKGNSTRSAKKNVGSSPDSGNSKSAIGTSGGTVSTTAPIPPTLLVPRSVPKVTTTGPIPPTLHIPRSVPRGQNLARDSIPLGESCQLCAIDLAFLPCNSGSGSSRDPPVCAILPCGHALHASCLESFYGSSLEPQCPTCVSGPVEGCK